MGSQRKLKNAPITEAVIDLRLADSVSISVDDKDRLHDSVGAREFPIVEVQQDFVARFRSRVQSDPGEVDHALVGFHFRQESEVVQFRINGFTFSRLKPYTDWEHVVGNAMRGWSAYVDELGPIGNVSRVAVRYINHMTFKRGEFSLDEIFEAPLRGPDGVPSDVMQYELRTLHRVTEHRAVFVTQAMLPADGGFAVRLDIDAFEAGSFKSEEESLLPVLGELRELKNSVFFSTLTDKVIERYE